MGPISQFCPFFFDKMKETGTTFLSIQQQTSKRLFVGNCSPLENHLNNLLNRKKFVFPEFDFYLNSVRIVFEAGYISWSELHKIFDTDMAMDVNLRKARKFTYQTLHLGNNQSVSLNGVEHI